MEASTEAPALSGKPAERRTPGVLIVTILVVCCLLAGGVIVYLFATPAQSDQIDTLKNKVEELQNQLLALEAADDSQHQVVQDNVSLAQLYAEVKDSVVTITDTMIESAAHVTEEEEVQGSGFVFNLTGEMVIVTNYHVVDDATGIDVAFSDGNAYPATVLGYDAYSDLAVLSVNAPANEFEPLQIANSSSLQVGDFVAAIGSPYGLEGSMTTGIVSQLGRTITESAAGDYPIGDVIQTSAPINPGNSGGPLLNDKGQVVGITTAVANDSQGIGFAISSNTILREIVSLADDGSYDQHSWMGIGTIDMDYDIAQEMSLSTTYGVLVEQVTSNGPADQAGLKGGNNLIDGSQVTIGGDVIIAIDGHRIINSDALYTYLEENTKPNQTIDLTVVRDGGTMTISLVLGVRPSLT